MENGYITPPLDYREIQRNYEQSSAYDPNYKELQEIHFWHMQNENRDNLKEFYEWFLKEININNPGFYAWGDHVKFNSGKIGRIVVRVCELTYRIMWYIQIAI